MTTRLAFLDDYQNVAGDFAPLERIPDVEWISVTEHLAGADLARAVAGRQVLVAMRERTRFDADMFTTLPDLRLLVTTGPGNAAIDLAAASQAGVTVCATGVGGRRGLASGNTAELTWGLILSVLRHIPAEDAAMRSGGWQHTVGTDLEGATLGLVGLGRIGQRMAKVAQAFGMEVIAWSQHLDPQRAHDLGVDAVAKEDLFGRADVVSIHVLLSARTRGLIGAAELGVMRPGAILVNTSRGPIVDNDALVAALNSGQLAGAGLDVFDTEPLEVDHPLRRAPRTVLTPHLGYVTKAGLEAWYSDVVDDVAAWEQGAPIRVLNP